MSLPCSDELIAVARIAKPFGVRGEINAVPLTPPVISPEEVVLGRLYLRPQSGPVREVRGEAVREHKDRWLIRLCGVETPEAVAEMRFAELCLLIGDLPELPEGMYWEHELQTCRVVDARRGELGQAAELLLGNAQTRLAVRRPGGSTIELPWTPPLVAFVDLEDCRIDVDLPDGWPGLDPGEE